MVWLSGPLVFIQLSCCCIYVAGLIEAGCLLPPGGVLANYCRIWIYCLLCLCRSMFVLGGGGGGSTNLWWVGGGGPSDVLMFSPGDLFVWGCFVN